MTFDSDSMWNRMSQGKDSINLNDPANQRTRDMMMRTGATIPPNGILTKAEFKTNFEKQMAARAAGGGRGGPGGMPGAPGSPQVQTMSMTPGANGQMMMSVNGGPPQPVQGNMQSMGGGGRSGFDPMSMTDDQIKGMMARSYELDPSGRISMAAAQNGRGNLREQFTTYDMNRDGFIDTNEYRGVIAARMNERNGGGNNNNFQFQPGMNGGQPGGWGGAQPPGWGGAMPPGGNSDRGNRKRDEEEEKPVVYRFGNMPKEVPSWFEQLDGDKDGQVGLYEWRSARRLTQDFEDFDLNGDGYVTAEEWLRKQRMDLTKREEEEHMAKPAGVNASSTGRGGAGGFGGRGGAGGPPAGFGGGTSQDRPAPSGRNPFTGAGGPPAGGRGGPPGGMGERGPRGGPGGERGSRGDTSGENRPSKEEKRTERPNRPN
jgi:Ca2+-binding EF-hand superfamily protein